MAELLERAEAIAVLDHDDPTTCRALKSLVGELAAALKAAEAEIKQLRNMERNARRTLTMERETLCKSRDRQLDVAKSQAEQAEADLAAARTENERLSQRCIDIIEIELKINSDQVPTQVADRCLKAIRALLGEQGK